MRIVRILLAAFLLVVTLCAALMYVFRERILEYAAEKVILPILPDFVTIDRISFDLGLREVTAEKIRVRNPAGFSADPILTIGALRCTYAFRGLNPLDGIDIARVRIESPCLTIERLGDGRTNIEALKSSLANVNMKRRAMSIAKEKKEVRVLGLFLLPKEPPRLPAAIRVSDASIVFSDDIVTGRGRARVLDLDNIEATVSPRFGRNYSRLLSLASEGKGYLFGDTRQAIDWVISLDLTRPKLTMSNRLTLSHLDMLPLQPYFYRYSPFVIARGTVSGDVVLDFDNGNIGSMNTLRFEGLRFSVKPGYEYAQLLNTTVPELVKYLTSSSGEVVFDFKVKGEMPHPQFVLGPVASKAVTITVVDKVAATALNVASKSGVSPPDVQKAQEMIDMIKGFMQK